MTTIHVHVNGHPVGLIRQGRGQPVLLLHSSGANGAQWRQLIDLLSPHCLVLAPDLHGHGNTAPWPAGQAFGFADEAALVQGLLQTLPEPAHLVGHSYGAATALHVALRSPAAVRSLALVEPVAFHLLRDGDDTDRAALNEFLAACDTMARMRARGDALGAIGHFVDYWNGLGAWDALPADKQAALASAGAAVTQAFNATTADPVRIADVRRVTLPTLLLQGSATRAPACRVCLRLARAWPHARLERIQGAGHMSPVTHRNEVNALLVDHLLAQIEAPLHGAAPDR